MAKSSILSGGAAAQSVPAAFVALVLFLHSLGAAAPAWAQSAHPDYGKACALSTLYFEAQRSGKLPWNQRVTWRRDSALTDGADVGADLSKGYFDSGDNVKFGYPMAYSITMLAWSVVEYSKQLDTLGELDHAMDAVRWGTDYLINAHPYPNTLYVGVGDGDSDHACWMRPEDMTTDRTTYKVDSTAPGTDIAAESAAALAAASIVFQYADSDYSATCLSHAKDLFTFADTYRGGYSDSVPNVQAYYPSSEWKDELLWAAAWLYKATGDNVYMQYLLTNGNTWGGSSYSTSRVSWDEKIPTLQTLVAQNVLQALNSNVGAASAKGPGTVAGYWQMAQNSACAFMKDAPKTPGGLVYQGTWSSLQYVTPMLLNLLILADSLGTQTLGCASGDLQASDIVTFVQGQMDYILGNNPLGMSYMIGFGTKYPLYPHHRSSSLPSITADAKGNISCTQGWSWYWSNNANLNVLRGGIVGGPQSDDSWDGARDSIHENEPSTYIVAPLVGALARLAAGGSANSAVQNAASVLPLIRSKVSENDLAQVLQNYTSVAKDFVQVFSKVKSSWRKSGKEINRYEVTVVNTQGKTVEGLVVLANNFRPLRMWNLVPQAHSDGYLLGHQQTLKPHEKLHFRYVQAGEPATFSIQGQVKP